MAQSVGTEVMYKREGNLGMTTLSFRSKRYTFPSLIVKPDMGSSDDPNAEGVCVLLDVGLACPFCTGTFTAKFVRSHARLAISKTGFEAVPGEVQAIEGVETQQSGEAHLHPEHCCVTHAETQTHSHPGSDPDSDLELRRTVESELEGSGIHVHVTPNRPGVKPRVANVRPLGRTQAHPYQQHQQHPHQHFPHMHRPKQSQGEAGPRPPAPREGSSLYVQEKSSHFVVKHDLSKKHAQPTSKKTPPAIAPRSPSHVQKKGTSPKLLQKRPNQQQHRSSRDPRITENKAKRASASRRKRCSSVERQEIVYEGETIASGGYLETNLDDFPDSIKAEREGQPRNMPTQTLTTDETSGHSSDYGSMDSPGSRDGHAKVSLTDTSPIHEGIATDTERQPARPPLLRSEKASPQTSQSTKHGSLERPSTSGHRDDLSWANAYDVRHFSHPMNRSRKGQRQVSPKKASEVNSVPGLQVGEERADLGGNPTGYQSQRTPTVSNGHEQIPPAEGKRGDVVPEGKKRKSTTPNQSETTVKEILETAAKYIKSDQTEVQTSLATQPKRESENLLPQTEERIISYIGEQAEINKYQPELSHSVKRDSPGPVAKQHHPMDKAEAPDVVMDLADTPKLRAIQTSEVEEMMHTEELDDATDNVLRDGEGAEAPYAADSNSDDSDTGSEVEGEEFHPEDTVDQILESVDTETYSPNSTLSRAFTGPRRKRKRKGKRSGRPPPKEIKELTDQEVSISNKTQTEPPIIETVDLQKSTPIIVVEHAKPKQIESTELHEAISRIVEKNTRPVRQGKTELHQAVSRIVENEMRTPSPETVLEEILEGVDVEEETVPDSPEHKKHFKMTMASMDSQTTTTFTSVELQQSFLAQSSVQGEKDTTRSQSPSRHTLQTTLTSLKELQSEKTVSRSSSTECLPEDPADTGSIGRSVSTYDGTSENSADDDVRDSEGSEFHASNGRAGSDTSIERIIDRTLYLTDKIIAAYPELRQDDQDDREEGGVRGNEATQFALSDSDDMADGQEDSGENVATHALHISTDSGSSSLERGDANSPAYHDHQVTRSLPAETRIDGIDYQFHGAYDELNQYMKAAEEGSTDSLKEVYDSELSVMTDSDFIETDFHFSEAYSPPSPMIKPPCDDGEYGWEEEKGEEREKEEKEGEAVAIVEPSKGESTETTHETVIDTSYEGPQAKNLILDRVTRELYDIQHSLAVDGERWLREDFYQDAEMTELESLSSQGTLEKNRLSAEIQCRPESGEDTDDATNLDYTSKSPDYVGSDGSLRMVPRKVQFWVPSKTDEVRDQDPETIEAFETVEKSMREVEKAVKEMAGLDVSTDDEILEVPSQTDLQEVTDDQYNSEHTIDDTDQLESSCNEEFGSEFEDVIEAVVDEELKDSEEVLDTSLDEGLWQISPLGPMVVHAQDTEKISKDEEPSPKPHRYVSPIQSSSSESSLEDEPEPIVGRTCEDVIREVRIEQAQAETFVQDIVREDSLQRSELCITYVNIDGSSSSETVSDAVTDTTEESDSSVINVQTAPERLENQTEVVIESHEMAYEPNIGFGPSSFLSEELETVETLPKSDSLVCDSSDEDDIETARKIETLSLSLSSSSPSDSDSVDTDEFDSTIEACQKFATPENIEVVETISSQRYGASERKVCDKYEAIDTRDVYTFESLKDQEEDLILFESEPAARDSPKERRPFDPSTGYDALSKQPQTDEVAEESVDITTFTQDLDPLSKTHASSEPHHQDTSEHSPKHLPQHTPEEGAEGMWGHVLAESTTNVASFETEDVLSKEQAQEFLRHMFRDHHKESHEHGTKEIACLDKVSTDVAETGEEGEVTSEEVSTQEVTLIFAWPKKVDEVIKTYNDPFREIRLHRVTKIKDFDIEVVEGPTVTTIERPPIPAIALEKKPDENLTTKLPVGKDAIVVHQKRKDTVTKRKKQPKSERVPVSTETESEKDKPHSVSRKEDEDEGSSCGRSKSSDMEVDLDELLEDVLDVSGSFDFGGEPGKPSKKDASAQTDSLQHDSYALSDDQLMPSLLARDSDSADEGSCMSDSSQGELCTHAPTHAQGSLAHRPHGTAVPMPYHSEGSSHQNGQQHVHTLHSGTQCSDGPLTQYLTVDPNNSAHGAGVVLGIANPSKVDSAVYSSDPETIIYNISSQQNYASSSKQTRISTSGITQNMYKNTLDLGTSVGVVSTAWPLVPYIRKQLLDNPSYLKGKAIIDRRVEARQSGTQLLLVTVENEDLVRMQPRYLSNGDGSFNIDQTGQCYAKPPLFGKVTLEECIDKNTKLYHKTCELEGGLVNCTECATQLTTEGVLQPQLCDPLVENADWTCSVQCGMAYPDLKGCVLSTAQSSETPCFYGSCDRHNLTEEAAVGSTKSVIAEVTQITVHIGLCQVEDQTIFFALGAYHGTEYFLLDSPFEFTHPPYCIMAWVVTAGTALMIHVIEVKLHSTRPNGGLKQIGMNRTVDCENSVGQLLFAYEETPVHHDSTWQETTFSDTTGPLYYCAMISDVGHECSELVNLLDTFQPVSVRNSGWAPLLYGTQNRAADIHSHDGHDVSSEIHETSVGYVELDMDLVGQCVEEVINEAFHAECVLGETSPYDLVTLGDPLCCLSPCFDTETGGGGGGSGSKKKKSGGGGSSEELSSGQGSSHGDAGTDGGYGGGDQETRGSNAGGAAGSGGDGRDNDDWDKKDGHGRKGKGKGTDNDDEDDDDEEEDDDDEEDKKTTKGDMKLTEKGTRGKSEAGTKHRVGTSGGYNIERVHHHLSFKPVETPQKSDADESRKDHGTERIVPIIAPTPMKSDVKTSSQDHTVEKEEFLSRHSAASAGGDIRELSEIFDGMARAVGLDQNTMATFAGSSFKPHLPDQPLREHRVMKQNVQYDFESSSGYRESSKWETSAQIPMPETKTMVMKQEHVATPLRMEDLKPLSQTERIIGETHVERSQKEQYKTAPMQEPKIVADRRLPSEMAPSAADILASFRKQARKDDDRLPGCESDPVGGIGVRRTIIEVHSHDTPAVPPVETVTLDSGMKTQLTEDLDLQGRVISDTTTYSREQKSVSEERAALEYEANRGSVTNMASAWDKHFQRPEPSGSSEPRLPTSDVISGRPPVHPSRRRSSDSPEDESMTLFNTLHYLNNPDTDTVKRRVSDESYEKKTVTVSDSSQVEASAMRSGGFPMEKLPPRGSFVTPSRMERYAIYSRPLCHAQVLRVTTTFDSIISCRPIHPIRVLYFCAVISYEESACTTFGCIDMVHCYDAVGEESSTYSESVGYSDDEYLTRSSASEVLSDSLSGDGRADDALRIYHDGKLVAKVHKERVDKSSSSEENVIQRGSLPQLESFSPVVRHQSSRAFIEDHIPGRYAEERYDTEMFRQNLGGKASLSGMHSSTFSHYKTGAWTDASDTRSNLPLTVEHVRTVSPSTQSYSLSTTHGAGKDKFDSVVEALKRDILGFGNGGGQRVPDYQLAPIRGPERHYIQQGETSTSERTMQTQYRQPPSYDDVQGDGVLRLYYEEDMIRKIKRSLQYSYGTTLDDNGYVLKVYHNGKLVAEINRSVDHVQEVENQASENVALMKTPPSQIKVALKMTPSLQPSQKVRQSSVHILKREDSKPDPTESIADSISIASNLDSEDEYFFEEYTVEHKVPIDVSAPNDIGEPRITEMISTHSKNEGVPYKPPAPVPPPRTSSTESTRRYAVEVDRIMAENREKARKAAVLKQQKELRQQKILTHSARVEKIEPTVKQTQVQVSKPSMYTLPVAPIRQQAPPQERPLWYASPERDIDTFSECSTSSWMTDTDSSTITEHPTPASSPPPYRNIHQPEVATRVEEQPRKLPPFKAPPQPQQQAHTLPHSYAKVSQKPTQTDTKMSVIDDIKRQIDEMYSSLTADRPSRKPLPKYVRKQPPAQKPALPSTQKAKLVEEVKKHLYDLRSQTNRPLTPEYKAELMREIKRRIYESRLQQIQTSNRSVSAGQRWLEQTQRTRDIDEVSEADSTASWTTVASGGTTTTGRSTPFHEVTVIVDPREDHPETRYPQAYPARYPVGARDFSRFSDVSSHSSYSDQQHRMVSFNQRPRAPPPVDEQAYRQYLQMMQQSQGYQNFKKMQQSQRINYEYVQQQPQIQRAPSPEPIYVERVELQEIARQDVERSAIPIPEEEPIYVEQVELQEIARHDVNKGASSSQTMRPQKPTRTSWSGEPNLTPLAATGKASSLPVLHGDIYDSMYRMLASASTPIEEEQVYDNLPGHVGYAGTMPGDSKDQCYDVIPAMTTEEARLKAQEYIRSAYEFINEDADTYDNLPDTMPKQTMIQRQQPGKMARQIQPTRHAIGRGQASQQTIRQEAHQSRMSSEDHLNTRVGSPTRTVVSPRPPSYDKVVKTRTGSVPVDQSEPDSTYDNLAFVRRTIPKGYNTMAAQSHQGPSHMVASQGMNQGQVKSMSLPHARGGIMRTAGPPMGTSQRQVTTLGPHSMPQSMTGQGMSAMHVASNQRMASRMTASQASASRAGTSRMMHSRGSSTDRLVIERPDELASRERSSSTSSCASSIPQVDLDALDKLLLEIGYQGGHFSPTGSLDEDDGAYATIPAHNVARTFSENKVSFDGSPKDVMCAGVPHFPVEVLEVPPELKLQTHPKLLRSDRDEMLKRLQHVRSVAKKEKRSKYQLQNEYRSELKRYIEGKGASEGGRMWEESPFVEEDRDIYATVNKPKKSRQTKEEPLQKNPELSQQFRMEHEKIVKPEEPDHYNEDTVPIYERPNLLQRPTMGQIHEHRKKMKPCLDAIKSVQDQKKLQTALNQMKQQQEIQNQFSKAALYTERYAKTKSASNRSSSQQKKEHSFMRHKERLKDHEQIRKTERMKASEFFQPEKYLDQYPQLNTRIEREEGGHVPTTSGNTSESWREQIVQTPPLLNMSSPKMSTKQTRGFEAGPSPYDTESPKSSPKGQHRIQLEIQLEAIKEESNFSSDSSSDGQGCLALPQMLQQHRYIRHPNMSSHTLPQRQRHHPHSTRHTHHLHHQSRQYSTTPKFQTLSPSRLSAITEESDSSPDRKKNSSDSDSQSHHSACRGTPTSDKIQCHAYDLHQEHTDAYLPRNQSVKDLIYSMEDYYSSSGTSRSNCAQKPTTFAHAGNAEIICKPFEPDNTQPVSRSCSSHQQKVSDDFRDSFIDESHQRYFWRTPEMERGIVIKGFIYEQICYKFHDACLQETRFTLEIVSSPVDCFITACTQKVGYQTPVRLHLPKRLPSLPSQQDSKDNFETCITLMDYQLQDVCVVQRISECVLFACVPVVCDTTASHNMADLPRENITVITHQRDQNCTEIFDASNPIHPCNLSASCESAMMRQDKHNAHCVHRNMMLGAGINEVCHLGEGNGPVIGALADVKLVSCTGRPTMAPVVYNAAKDSGENLIETKLCSEKCFKYTAENDQTCAVNTATCVECTNSLSVFGEAMCNNICHVKARSESAISSLHGIYQSRGSQKRSSSEGHIQDIIRLDTLYPQDRESMSREGLYTYSSESAISDLYSDDGSSSPDQYDRWHGLSGVLHDPKLKALSSSDSALPSLPWRHRSRTRGHARDIHGDQMPLSYSNRVISASSESAIADIYAGSTSSSDSTLSNVPDIDVSSITDIYRRIVSLTEGIDSTIYEVINEDEASIGAIDSTCESDCSSLSEPMEEKIWADTIQEGLHLQERISSTKQRKFGEGFPRLTRRKDRLHSSGGMSEGDSDKESIDIADNIINESYSAIANMPPSMLSRRMETTVTEDQRSRNGTVAKDPGGTHQILGEYVKSLVMGVMSCALEELSCAMKSGKIERGGTIIAQSNTEGAVFTATWDERLMNEHNVEHSRTLPVKVSETARYVQYDTDKYWTVRRVEKVNLGRIPLEEMSSSTQVSHCAANTTQFSKTPFTCKAECTPSELIYAEDTPEHGISEVKLVCDPHSELASELKRETYKEAPNSVSPAGQDASTEGGNNDHTKSRSLAISPHLETGRVHPSPPNTGSMTEEQGSLEGTPRQRHLQNALIKADVEFARGDVTLPSETVGFDEEDQKAINKAMLSKDLLFMTQDWVHTYPGGPDDKYRLLSTRFQQYLHLAGQSSGSSADVYPMGHSMETNDNTSESSSSTGSSSWSSQETVIENPDFNIQYQPGVLLGKTGPHWPKEAAKASSAPVTPDIEMQRKRLRDLLSGGLTTMPLQGTTTLDEPAFASSSQSRKLNENSNISVESPVPRVAPVIKSNYTEEATDVICRGERLEDANRRKDISLKPTGSGNDCNNGLNTWASEPHSGAALLQVGKLHGRGPEDTLWITRGKRLSTTTEDLISFPEDEVCFGEASNPPLNAVDLILFADDEACDREEEDIFAHPPIPSTRFPMSLPDYGRLSCPVAREQDEEVANRNRRAEEMRHLFEEQFAVFDRLCAMKETFKDILENTSENGKECDEEDDDRRQRRSSAPDALAVLEGSCDTRLDQEDMLSSCPVYKSKSWANYEKLPDSDI